MKKFNNEHLLHGSRNVNLGNSGLNRDTFQLKIPKIKTFNVPTIEFPEMFHTMDPTTGMNGKGTLTSQKNDVKSQEKARLKFMHQRYQQCKIEFTFFLKFHNLIYLLLFIARIKTHFTAIFVNYDFNYLVPQSYKGVISLFMVCCSILIKRLTFQQFRIMFLLILSTGIFFMNTEKILVQINPDRFLSHHEVIMISFFFYCCTISPFDWYVTISIKALGVMYYFCMQCFYLENSKINYSNVFQHIIITSLLARSLLIYQRRDIANIKLQKDNEMQQQNYYSILQSIPEGFMIMDKFLSHIEFTNLQMVKLFQSQEEQQLTKIDAFIYGGGTEEMHLSSKLQNLNMEFINGDQHHNNMLCTILKQKIQDYVLEPIKEKDNQNQLFQQDEEFIPNIKTQINTGEDNTPMYYKMVRKEEGAGNQRKTRQPSKRRVEIKCKKLKGGKTLIIVKDLNLYTKLEKNRTKNQLRTLFFASFAHELITPINIIQGLNDELVFQSDEFHPKFKDILGKGKTTIQKLAFLVEDIVDLTRNEHRKLSLNKIKFSVKDAIQEVLELYDLEINQKGLKFIKSMNLGDVNIIYTDKRKLQRVLSNLLGNALKYTTKGFIKIKASVAQAENDIFLCQHNLGEEQDLNDIDMSSMTSDNRQGFNISEILYDNQDSFILPVVEDDQQLNSGAFRVHASNDNHQRFSIMNPQTLNMKKKYLKISVQDTGIGIQKEQIAKLFKLFENPKFKGRVNQCGMGLGLSISKVLCQALSGHIQYVHKESAGSKFRFYIRFHEVREHSAHQFHMNNIFNINYRSDQVEDNRRLEIFPSDLDNGACQFEQPHRANLFDASQSFQIPFEMIQDQISPTIDHKIKNHTANNKQSLLSIPKQDHNFQKQYTPRNDQLDKSNKLIFTDVDEENEEVKVSADATILIVDDQQFNVQVAGMMIERLTGKSFDSAYSAMQGIEMIKQKHVLGKQYSHIFLDINMPEMDGVEMIQYLRKVEEQKNLDFSKTQIFALTALDQSQLGNIKELGFDRYIPKPLTWDYIKHIFN